MSNVYLLLCVSLVLWYFFYLRKVAEMGKYHAQRYCQHEKLQFIAVARKSSKLRFAQKQGFYWLSDFDFEFSGDGESKYQGEIILHGLKLSSVNVPPYRI